MQDHPLKDGDQPDEESPEDRRRYLAHVRASMNFMREAQEALEERATKEGQQGRQAADRWTDAEPNGA
jgi:hypothetical protein